MRKVALLLLALFSLPSAAQSWTRWDTLDVEGDGYRPLRYFSPSSARIEGATVEFQSMTYTRWSLESLTEKGC
jgi:hypothetical protein